MSRTDSGHTYAGSAKWSSTVSNASTPASRVTDRLRAPSVTATDSSTSTVKPKYTAPSSSTGSRTSQVTHYPPTPDNQPPNWGIPPGTYRVYNRGFPVGSLQMGPPPPPNLSPFEHVTSGSAQQAFYPPSFTGSFAPITSPS